MPSLSCRVDLADSGLTAFLRLELTLLFCFAGGQCQAH